MSGRVPRPLNRNPRGDKRLTRLTRTRVGMGASPVQAEQSSAPHSKPERLSKPD